MTVSPVSAGADVNRQCRFMRYTLEQYELAVASGVPLEGYCWFPTVDSCDWDSLLARPARRIDPVGVWALEPDGTTRRTSMTLAWEAAAAGAPVSLLPAYRFQQPVASRLAGFLPQMSHWPWTDPPPWERVPPVDLRPPPCPCPSARPPRGLPEEHPCPHPTAIPFTASTLSSSPTCAGVGYGSARST
jgi:hypothetical protein